MSGSSNAEILEVESVAVDVGRRRLLSDVTFTATPGSLTAIVGVNGIGKSTLMRALAGITPPAADSWLKRVPPRPQGTQAANPRRRQPRSGGADAHVVAQRARRAADERAGCGAFAHGLGDDGTGDGATGGTLRVSRQAGVVARRAGREAGGDESDAANAEDERFLHVVLPVFEARFRAIDSACGTTIAWPPRGSN